MADLITIGQLSALIEDQYRLMGVIEDEGDRLPKFDPICPERNQVELTVSGEPWSVTATRTCWEFCHQDARRTVMLQGDHPSPFEFHPSALLRYVLSLDETSQLTDVVMDNWILKLIRAGRLSVSPHRTGYYTFA
jgi:hypothetical protein